MIHMEAVIYSRVSSESQDNERQIINLKTVAQEKGWHVRRTFQEKISGTIKSGSRNEFKALFDYLDKTPVQVVMVQKFPGLAEEWLMSLTLLNCYMKKELHYIFNNLICLPLRTARRIL